MRTPVVGVLHFQHIKNWLRFIVIVFISGVALFVPKPLFIFVVLVCLFVFRFISCRHCIFCSFSVTLTLAELRTNFLIVVDTFKNAFASFIVSPTKVMDFYKQ